MILSVSRRTDIPAFYTPWFLNRLHEGYVSVRNPMNYHQVSKVSLHPDVIDCAVFWTKNAAPLLPYLEEIEQRWPFYFQYTLNAYGRNIEPALPTLEEKLHTFIQLSERIGPERVIWRYDPVLLTETYTVNWHMATFDKLASLLEGKVKTCVFSFIDIYPKMQTNIKAYDVHACTSEDMNILAATFSESAQRHHMEICTCAEAVDLDRFGIRHGCCVDGSLIQRLTGSELAAKKDPNQRPECGCLESVDIGQYNTCRHGCRYCYANFNQQSVVTLSKQHDPMSPLLIGKLEAADKITERKMKSLKKHAAAEQISMF